MTKYKCAIILNNFVRIMGIITTCVCKKNNLYEIVLIVLPLIECSLFHKHTKNRTNNYTLCCINDNKY